MSELVKALKALPNDTERRIRAAAAFRGYNQDALAAGAGVPPFNLSRALNGHREFTEAERAAIATFLDVPEAILFPEVTA